MIQYFKKIKRTSLGEQQCLFNPLLNTERKTIVSGHNPSPLPSYFKIYQRQIWHYSQKYHEMIPEV